MLQIMVVKITKCNKCTLACGLNAAPLVGNRALHLKTPEQGRRRRQLILGVLNGAKQREFAARMTTKSSYWPVCIHRATSDQPIPSSACIYGLIPTRWLCLPVLSREKKRHKTLLENSSFLLVSVSCNEDARPFSSIQSDPFTSHLMIH